MIELKSMFKFLGEDLSWKKILNALFLIITVFAIFLFYEYQASTFQLSKLEKSVIILEKIESLNFTDRKSNAVRENIYDRLIDITQKTSLFNSYQTKIKHSILFAIIWVVLLIYFIWKNYLGKVKDQDFPAGVIGCIVLGILMGFLGYFIPTTWDWWLYFLLPIIINFIIIKTLIWFGENKQKNQ